MSRLGRITSNPDICNGQPTVRGLRYTVETLLELLSAEMPVDEVLEDYADLEREDVLAVLEFAAVTVGRRAAARHPWSSTAASTRVGSDRGLAVLFAWLGLDGAGTRDGVARCGPYRLRTQRGT